MQSIQKYLDSIESTVGHNNPEVQEAIDSLEIALKRILEPGCEDPIEEDETSTLPHSDEGKTSINETEAERIERLIAEGVQKRFDEIQEAKEKIRLEEERIKSMYGSSSIVESFTTHDLRDELYISYINVKGVFEMKVKSYIDEKFCVDLEKVDMKLVCCSSFLQKKNGDIVLLSYYTVAKTPIKESVNHHTIHVWDFKTGKLNVSKDLHFKIDPTIGHDYILQPFLKSRMLSNDSIMFKFGGYKCSCGEKYFHSQADLRQHIYTDHSTRSCNVHGKSFSHLSQGEQQMLSEKYEKPPGLTIVVSEY